MPLKVSDGIGTWIKDFKKSKAPQFKGKNEKERRDMAVAAYLSAKNESQEVKEETNFQVNIEGLPMMFIGGMSPGEVKAKLRGIVKQPSMIKSVRRVTDAEVKKNFRLKAQGRDDEEEVEEQYKYDYGTPESVRLMKKITPGEKNEKHMVKDKKLKNLYVPNPKDPTPFQKAKKIMKNRQTNEGSESWESGYKRRVVKTTKPEHKAKGYNWRIKGKDRPEISIKLYREKPSQAEFNKQMKRVAGHEFG